LPALSIKIISFSKGTFFFNRSNARHALSFDQAAVVKFSGGYYAARRFVSSEKTGIDLIHFVPQCDVGNIDPHLNHFFFGTSGFGEDEINSPAPVLFALRCTLRIGRRRFEKLHVLNETNLHVSCFYLYLCKCKFT
jgi:hypothetical protein